MSDTGHQTISPSRQKLETEAKKEKRGKKKKARLMREPVLITIIWMLDDNAIWSDTRPHSIPFGGETRGD